MHDEYTTESKENTNFKIETPLKPKQLGNEYNPYEFNAGTTLAITTPLYTIMASDTRNSSDYTINSRFCSKIFKLSNNVTLTGTGFYGDLHRLYELLKIKQNLYYQKYEIPIKIKELAHYAMNLLYSRRFFPFYSFIIISGIEENSENEKRCVMYSYDPVGSYKEDIARCYGTGQNIIQPILDSKVYRKHNTEKILTENEVKEVVIDAFKAAAERDVKTGDCLEIVVIRNTGEVENKLIELRRD